MPRFKYIAMDAKGKEVTNTLEADSTAAADARIRELGFFPTSVTEVGVAKAKKEKAPVGVPGRAAGPKKSLLKLQIGGGKVKGKQLAQTTRQLATLIEAGLPLLRGLNVLRKQEKHVTLNRTLGALAEAIESGS